MRKFAIAMGISLALALGVGASASATVDLTTRGTTVNGPCAAAQGAQTVIDATTAAGVSPDDITIAVNCP